MAPKKKNQNKSGGGAKDDGGAANAPDVNCVNIVVGEIMSVEKVRFFMMVFRFGCSTLFEFQVWPYARANFTPVLSRYQTTFPIRIGMPSISTPGPQHPPLKM